MVENKVDFGHESVLSVTSNMEIDLDVNPPLVNVTIAHPAPSAPLEQATPSFDGTFTGGDEIRRMNMYQSTLPPPDTNESSDGERQMVASGVTAAVFGFFFLGGPIGAVILGFSTAYASQKEGAAGDIARSVGDVGVSIKEKAKKINDKHHLIERSSQAATKAWQKAKEYDREHHILEKFVRLLNLSWQQFTYYVQEHRLLERGVESAGRAYEFIAERVSGNSTAPTNTQPAERVTRPNTNQYHNVPVTVFASTH
jgi:hypothetical protein